jgi:hypothetical protein
MYALERTGRLLGPLNLLFKAGQDDLTETFRKKSKNNLCRFLGADGRFQGIFFAKLGVLGKTAQVPLNHARGAGLVGLQFRFHVHGHLRVTPCHPQCQPGDASAILAKAQIWSLATSLA